MGSSYVNDFVEFGRVYEVLLGAEGSRRADPRDVLDLSVRNADGEMVSFGVFAKVEPVMGQASVNRYNMYNTASVTGTAAKDVSSSAAIEAMEEILHDVGGNNYSFAWTGEAYQETQAGTTITTVLLFAVIITLLVLAAQYESWTDPVARHHHHPDRHTRHSPRLYDHEPKHQHLHPDRHHPPPRHGGQERHPHRRVCHGLPPRRTANTPGRRRRRTRAIPSYHDDSACLCLRRHAHALRHRRRRRGAEQPSQPPPPAACCSSSRDMSFMSAGDFILSIMSNLMSSHYFIYPHWRTSRWSLTP